uniref:Uncharacterized protein n=1 Tax=Cajanus cajan TaxID=3821 RepID=A0A151U3U5_CAJCA|nr:hypothetical protein KK1_006602 [Cajanus cajan]
MKEGSIPAAPIPDAINTLIMAIVKHFIGDPSIWKDRFGELLSNLKCRTLGDFRWYKDTFLTRVYTRDDSNQPFRKEKFLARLPYIYIYIYVYRG